MGKGTIGKIVQIEVPDEEKKSPLSITGLTFRLKSPQAPSLDVPFGGNRGLGL